MLKLLLLKRKISRDIGGKLNYLKRSHLMCLHLSKNTLADLVPTFKCGKRLGSVCHVFTSSN